MEENEDDPRGALVRPYAVTGGRTEPVSDIAIEAILLTTVRGRQESLYAGRDRNMIANLCDGRAMSLAEVAAHLRMPLGVARVLVADMTADGLLALHETISADDDDRQDLLERVLDGLRRL